MSDQDASYEVCILVGSRWEIHARYPATGAAAAIEEAKQLEQASKSAVKVVREIYDPSTGLYRQVAVYKSARSSFGGGESPASRTSGFRGGHAGDLDELDDLYEDGSLDEELDGGERKIGAFAAFMARRQQAARAKPRGPKRVTIAGLFLRVAALILAGLFSAALVTGILPSIAPNFAARNMAVAGGGQTSVLFVVFIATFLITFAILASIVLAGIQVVGPTRMVRARAAAPQRVRRPKAPRMSAPDFSVFGQDGGSLPEAGPDPEPEAEPPAPPAFAGEPDENLLDAETAPPDVQETQLSAAGQQQKMRMMTFLAGAIGEVKASGPIDPFSRFGINLFVAGAVAALAATQAIDEADARIVLADGVSTLGTPGEMARKFAENADSYLMQPRYLEMYEAGRRAMMAFLEGDGDGPRLVAPALVAWRNPAKREEKSGPLAVMFTDIVGSTNMTVTVGDDAAQYVVRTHNRIVRSALTNYSGREIKHTGDGIMASFSTVSNAVEAAIEMMRRVAANNAAEGDIPLHLRIGINAGEPVVEDDDLFGVTVQMSARLCAAAESDQIVVSEVVRGLCSGKDIPFVTRGTRDMKGFKEPIPIYEAVWRQNGGA